MVQLNDWLSDMYFKISVALPLAVHKKAVGKVFFSDKVIFPWDHIYFQKA